MHLTKEFLSMLGENRNEAVKSIIEERRLHHQVDKRKSTLLHYCVEYCNKEITKYLLSKGCYVDAQNIKKETPLMVAVRRWNGEIAGVLLDAGADMEIKNVNNKTALDIAHSQYPWPSVLVALFSVLKKKYSRLELAKYLLYHYRSLQHAVFLGDAGIIQWMLENGAPVENSSEKQFPLHQAIDFAHLKIVKVLLKYGADFDLRNEIGATPLNFLYRFNWEHNDEKFDILKILLRLGASMTSCDNKGFFHINATLIYGCYKAVHLVLQSNINFGAKDKHNSTILHCLAMNVNDGIVEVLKLHITKFDINAIDRRGCKPIDLAVKKGNVQMTKFLLDQGAKMDAALFYLYKSFDKKLDKLHDKCAEILLQSDADPQSVYTGRTGRKYTIFDIAMDDKYLSRMKFALAELAIREKRGVKITSLTYSKINSHPPFKAYFENCRQLLTLEIVESVSFFELVTADGKKVTEYLNNDELVEQLKSISKKDKFKSTFSYYNAILNERFATGSKRKVLKYLEP